MSLPRLEYATDIADQLNELSAAVKTRSRASLTDASHILETISARFFNALYGWDLVNLNVLRANYPAVDLGDRQRRIAIQVTNQEGSDKISHTAAKAIEHQLGKDFDRLIIFFLLPKKPSLPKTFIQPISGPKIETLNITDLLKEMQEMDDLETLARAAKVLKEEMGRIHNPSEARKFDISRILKYAPAELIGHEDELKLLNDAWAGRAELPLGQNVGAAQQRRPTRPHILTLVALGGEGKTSLVAKWAAELAAQDWPGCDAAFAWSFYSQGTREQHAASSDLFLKEALNFFGDDADKQFAASPAGAFEKGQRLARIVGQRRSLLILDGLEPLQYAPTSPTPGGLKDQGIAALLKGLAANSRGLCLVTTRYSLPDLRACWQTTAPEKPLPRLSTPAGVHLLQQLGVRKESGSPAEFAQLVEDVKGHALTLNLLGTYLRDAHAGDLRKRDRVKLVEADAEEQAGYAFRVMDAYVKWLEGRPLTRPSDTLSPAGGEGRGEGERARQMLTVLRLMGLFDRPATADCLGALWKTPAITGLTEPLVEMIEAQRNLVLQRLEDAKLLTVNREKSGELISLDAHPLLREYFAQQLKCGSAGVTPADFGVSPKASSGEASGGSRRRDAGDRDRDGRGPQTSDAWRAAHRRLYEYLCASTPDKPEPNLEDLQPLYQAVAHGCQAGLQQEACDRVYIKRILHVTKHYSWKKLGAFASDLGAVACFFEQPWSRLSPRLKRQSQAFLSAQAALYLRALGRLAEALEPMRRGLKMRVNQKAWDSAAIVASNLSELELTLGEVTKAVEDGEKSVTYADCSSARYLRIIMRTTHADALHHAGHRHKAQMRFQEIQQMHNADIDVPLFYSVQNFRYSDLFFTDNERTTWLLFLNPKLSMRVSELCAKCYSVSQDVAQTLKWIQEYSDTSLLDIALVHLTMGRIVFYQAILEDVIHRKESMRLATIELDAAVNCLRRAGQQQYLPLAQLSRAWLRFLTSAKTGPDSAQADLDEAWEIAERGPMKLFLADIHLYRARLFFRERHYPWNQNPDGTPRGPADDLAAAEKLINTSGYHRRDEELADAKKAILGK